MKLHSQNGGRGQGLFFFFFLHNKRASGTGALDNNGFMLTLSITAAGFPGPHDPEACVEMTSSLVSHSQSSRLSQAGGDTGEVQTDGRMDANNVR